jgi:hypothetical protein
MLMIHQHIVVTKSVTVRTLGKVPLLHFLPQAHSKQETSLTLQVYYLWIYYYYYYYS